MNISHMHRVHVREEILERLAAVGPKRQKPSGLQRRLRRLRRQMAVLERRLVAAELRAMEAEDRAREAEERLAEVRLPAEVPVAPRVAPSPARIALGMPWWRRVRLGFLAR
ncbi:MAG: hypothetical protein ACYCW6_16395 [Candidatus Xenobia bacterium]